MNMFTKHMNNRLFRAVSLAGIAALFLQMQAMALTVCRMELMALGSPHIEQVAAEHDSCVSGEQSKQTAHSSCEDCSSCPVCISQQTTSDLSSSILRTVEQMVDSKVLHSFSRELALSSFSFSKSGPDLTISFQLPPSTPVLRI